MTILIIAIVIIVLVVVLTHEKVPHKLDPSRIGAFGENQVANILRSLPQEYLVINNVIIPDQGKYGTTQIDHVVVSPFGIFVIETKNYSGWIFGSEKNKRWKETFKTTQGHYFYNPIKQNWGHIYALANHLKLDTNVFKPIVVFSNSCQLNVESTTPVVHMSGLKNVILYYRQEIIPQKSVPLIYNKLNKINLVGEEFETRHISSVGERLTKKKTDIQNGICPRCGGRLVLRNGRYGQFYGCSNYPECDYTLDAARR